MREIDGQNTKYHLHCLRHTFAVRQCLQTREIYLVKQELGHSSVVTTEIYAKFSLIRLE
jgi:site-specific recombinase XerD